MSKHNNKTVFRIDVGDISASDAENFIKAIKNAFKKEVPMNYLFEIKNQYKRELLVETKTKFKYNALSISEDYWIGFNQQDMLTVC